MLHQDKRIFTQSYHFNHCISSYRTVDRYTLLHGHKIWKSENNHTRNPCDKWTSGFGEVIKTLLDLKMRGKRGMEGDWSTVIGPGRDSNRIRSCIGGKTAQPTIINNKYGWIDFLSRDGEWIFWLICNVRAFALIRLIAVSFTWVNKRL